MSSSTHDPTTDILLLGRRCMGCEIERLIVKIVVKHKSCRISSGGLKTDLLCSREAASADGLCRNSTLRCYRIRLMCSMTDRKQ